MQNKIGNEIEVLGTRSMKELRRESKIRAWKRLAASILQFFLGRRFNQSMTSILLISALAASTSIYA